MSNTNDGGAAFPVTPTDKSGQIAPTECGMTLRDWFAGQAMNAVACSYATQAAGLSAGGHAKAAGEMMRLSVDFEAMADYSYQYADAMLAERDKTNEVAK